MSTTKETVITDFNFTVIKQNKKLIRSFSQLLLLCGGKIKHRIMVRGVTNGMCVA